MVADLGGECAGESLATCFGRVFEKEVEGVGADGERTAALSKWVPRGVSEKMHQFAEVIPDQDAVVIADPA